ncbi:MAG: hypothetical protein JXB14_01550 [Candidatus Altiarchaeota archaeon]|nr:hypothetical protein [Candidatus Altiarchaeota archaeon]
MNSALLALTSVLVVMLIIAFAVIFYLYDTCQKDTVCRPTYTDLGSSYCLDKNADHICDKYEPNLECTAISDSGLSDKNQAPSGIGVGMDDGQTNVLVGEETSGAEGRGSDEPSTRPDEGGVPQGLDNETLIDHLPAAICGDGLCYLEENSSNCPRDCGCAQGEFLVEGVCKRLVFTDLKNLKFEICGDGRCNYPAENFSNCCNDCGCDNGRFCFKNTCFLDLDIKLKFPVIEEEDQEEQEGVYDTYIVAVIEEIRIHDDKDLSIDPGELMLVTTTGTGDKFQQVDWPYENWYPVQSGDVLKKRIPIFSMEEEDMGDALFISVLAMDNDDMPGIDYVAEEIDSLLFGGQITAMFNELEEYMEDATMALDSASLKDEFDDKMDDLEDELCVGSDRIGVIHAVHLKQQDWGVSRNKYEAKGGDLTVKYSINRVKVRRNYELGAYLYSVRLPSTGDSYVGEVWITARVATNFWGRDLNDKVYRFPESGAYYAADGWKIHTDEGGPFMGYTGKGPFVFFEVSAWDEDNPEISDDHDHLGTTTWLYLYSDFDQEPLGQMEDHDSYIAFPWYTAGWFAQYVPFVTKGGVQAHFELVRGPTSF